jgi:hypothetical protein
VIEMGVCQNDIPDLPLVCHIGRHREAPRVESDTVVDDKTRQVLPR